MRIDWIVEWSDCEAVSRFVNDQRNKNFVLDRIRHNVDGLVPKFTRERFWKALVMCLLTTQQRSGPQSPVSRFLSADPFPLDLSACMDNRGEAAVLDRFRGAGGIRRIPTIARQLTANLQFLVEGGWDMFDQLGESLTEQRSREPLVSDVKTERAAAAALNNSDLRGIGPKQSRNLWQDLGLTRYEISLDSRITKWLRKAHFPVAVSATALADSGYYDFVMDGIQVLCGRAAVLPCVLDAAVFASYDSEWDERTLAAMR